MMLEATEPGCCSMLLTHIICVWDAYEIVIDDPVRWQVGITWVTVLSHLPDGATSMCPLLHYFLGIEWEMEEKEGEEFYTPRF